jgi:hypothetical protein
MPATGPDFISLQARDLDASQAFYEQDQGLVRSTSGPPHAGHPPRPRLRGRPGTCRAPGDAVRQTGSQAIRPSTPAAHAERTAVLPVRTTVLRRLSAAACVVVVTTSGATGCSGTPAGSTGPSASTSSSGLPSRSRWLADVRTAMEGSHAYLRRRANQEAGQRLAVNLDIDNTALASQYEWGAPVPPVRSFARLARSRGVAVLFNTGRVASGDGEALARRQLTEAGYHVDEICLRHDGEDAVAGKQRCRRMFANQGYTLIANVGNNETDFTGGGYGRAFRLPNYGRLY